MEGVPGRKLDTEEFLRLLRLNEKHIFAFILGLVHNHANAEDIMQETITVMWRKLAEYEPGTDFTAWALTVAKYRCYSYRRKFQNKQLQMSDDVLEYLQGSYPKMPQKHYQESVEALRKCVEKLGHADQTLLKMRYERDIAVSKLAKARNQTVQSIYRHLTQIYTMLLRCVRRKLSYEELS